MNIVVYIYRWTHAYVFGDADCLTPLISVWKSDVETHFEPLIPRVCECTLPIQLHIFLLLTSIAVLPEDLSELELRQLQCLPQWVAVQNATIPPSPPQSPLSSGMGDDNIGGGEAAPVSSVMPGGDIPRLRPRKQVVIVQSTTSSSDSSAKEDVQRQPSEGTSYENVFSAPGVK